MSNINTLDIAWLGGLLEGEGCFQDERGSPSITLATTDRDVMLRAARLMGVEAQATYMPGRKATYRPVHSCKAHGTRAIAWMMTLFPFFGERRQERVRGIIERWKASDRAPRAPRGQRFMATCHPDRVRTGRGLCQACYMREWRAAKQCEAL